MDYRAGKMIQKDYVSFKMKQEDRMEELRKQQQEWEKEKKALEKLETKYLAAIKALLKLKSGKDLTKRCSGGFCRKDICLSGKTDRSFVYGYG